MTVDEVRRFLAAVRAIAEDEMRSASGAERAGMERVRDALLQQLDVTAFAAAADEAVRDVGQRVEAFCFRWCAYGKQHGVGPGDHPVCQRCPLADMTVRRVQRCVDEALR